LKTWLGGMLVILFFCTAGLNNNEGRTTLYNWIVQVSRVQGRDKCKGRAFAVDHGTSAIIQRRRLSCDVAAVGQQQKCVAGFQCAAHSLILLRDATAASALLFFRNSPPRKNEMKGLIF